MELSADHSRRAEQTSKIEVFRDQIVCTKRRGAHHRIALAHFHDLTKVIRQAKLVDFIRIDIVDFRLIHKLHRTDIELVAKGSCFGNVHIGAEDDNYIRVNTLTSAAGVTRCCWLARCCSSPSGCLCPRLGWRRKCDTLAIVATDGAISGTDMYKQAWQLLFDQIGKLLGIDKACFEDSGCLPCDAFNTSYTVSFGCFEKVFIRGCHQLPGFGEIILRTDDVNDTTPDRQLICPTSGKLIGRDLLSTACAASSTRGSKTCRSGSTASCATALGTARCNQRSGDRWKVKLNGIHQ